MAHLLDAAALTACSAPLDRAPVLRRQGAPRENPTGVVLEVEEFAVHDGPGIRTAVFLKGCPLRCSWCHNPEAITIGPERMPTEVTCPACRARSVRSDSCPTCGTPLAPAPDRLVGDLWTADALATDLLRHRAVLTRSGGGVTFSGGEAMIQHAFVLAVTERVRPLHVAIETSGQVATPVFARVVEAMDLVMIDVKHTDPEVHRAYTGRDNSLIQANLRHLREASTPFIVRVPLIPGVNDGAENLERTAELVAGAPNLVGVELLPYNTMAPAKYARAGREFTPGFDTTHPPVVDTTPFDRHDIPCEVL